MPRCTKCGLSVSSRDLVVISSGVVCSRCVEDEMDNNKVVAKIELLEYVRHDGTKDYRIDIMGDIKGLALHAGFTFDQAREFFGTGSRSGDDTKKLRSIK
jgi:hypothetical protein